MKPIALLLLVGATACAANKPAATTPANDPATPNELGATNAQPAEDPNRALTTSECETLGGWIAEVCHNTHTRQARIEGWCGDMIAKTGAASWTGECQKTVKYMDSVCFRSVDTPQAMMTCDRTVDR